MTNAILFGAAAAIILVGGIAISKLFNTLVVMRNRYLNAFSQIQVQLKRRHDLIPNLVEVTKSYMAHESSTLEKVIAARNRASAGLKAVQGQPADGNAMNELMASETALTGAMGRFCMLMESYPDLKANENVRYLTEELTSTENKIGFSRQLYNDLVTVYNTHRQSFPAVLIASKIGHGEDAETLNFDHQPEIQEAPVVAMTS